MKRTIQCYTGISGSGKTSTILQLSQKYIQQGWNIGGIATIGNFQNNKRDSFWVIDILAPEIKIPLAKRDYSSEITIGCFGFQKKVLNGETIVLTERFSVKLIYFLLMKLVR